MRKHLPNKILDHAKAKRANKEDYEELEKFLAIIEKARVENKAIEFK